jgi:hypothetical protein
MTEVLEEVSEDITSEARSSENITSEDITSEAITSEAMSMVDMILEATAIWEAFSSSMQ